MPTISDNSTLSVPLQPGERENQLDSGLFDRMFRAISDDNVALVKLFLEKGFDAREPSLQGITPLMRAAELGRAEIVAELLPFSGPLRKNSHNQTALGCALVEGHPSIAKTLAEKGIPKEEEGEGHTWLMRAACSANAECVELALPWSDAKKATRDGDTALMIAAGQDRSAEAIALLLPVSDPLVKNRWGRTALHCAVGNEDAAGLALLLPVSDPLAQDHDGNTALHVAAMTRDEAAAVILAPKSDFSIKNNEGETAREAAMKNGGVEIAHAIDEEAARREQAALLAEIQADGGRSAAKAAPATRAIDSAAPGDPSARRQPEPRKTPRL